MDRYVWDYTNIKYIIFIIYFIWCIYTFKSLCTIFLLWTKSTALINCDMKHLARASSIMPTPTNNSHNSPPLHNNNCYIHMINIHVYDHYTYHLYINIHYYKIYTVLLHALCNVYITYCVLCNVYNTYYITCVMSACPNSGNSVTR